jgi:hypothetical protein
VRAGAERSGLQTECLIVGDPQTAVDVSIRFLHLVSETTGENDAPLSETELAIEREVCAPELSLSRLSGESISIPFRFGPAVDLPDTQEALHGLLEVSATGLREGVFRVTARARNLTPIREGNLDRDAALRRSLVSAHTVLHLSRGEFVSLIDPPPEHREAADGCRNVGVWPVLVGEEGQHDCMLASPIILYDYPQIAPESAGDLFDGTEIDELLTLRILTLTEQEKQAVREGDARAREILERTEALPSEQVMKMHGALRGVGQVKQIPLSPPLSKGAEVALPDQSPSLRKRG